MTMKHTKKQNTVFRFKNVEIHYNIPNTADVYYLTNDNIYNKEVNQFLIDLWYTRSKLLPATWIIEVSLGFEFAWRGIYYRDDELYLADKERRDNIRKVPILYNN